MNQRTEVTGHGNSPSHLQMVKSALGYVKKFTGTRVLIKLGGAALEDQSLVTQLCEDLSLIRGAGVNVVLVHGGGPAINRELERRGIQWNFIDGLRVTTPEMMDTIEMVLCGQVNRRIVRGLNQSAVRAIGLSGTDAQTLFCRPMRKDLGLVGEITEVRPAAIEAILRTQDEGMGTIPVIAPVGIGENGEAFNINADWAAVRIAEALDIDKILFLTDQDGILGPDGRLVEELDAGDLESFIENGVVKGGMLAKANTVLHALKNGVNDVHIFNARRPHGLLEELFTDQGVGTVCRLRSVGRKEF
ncbi:MAG: acetylglutamate kinase [Cryobacterium sp.]|nr:acetylglutamate kinase [Oligoflexia bacterium]